MTANERLIAAALDHVRRTWNPHRIVDADVVKECSYAPVYVRVAFVVWGQEYSQSLRRSSVAEVWEVFPGESQWAAGTDHGGIRVYGEW